MKEKKHEHLYLKSEGRHYEEYYCPRCDKLFDKKRKTPLHLVLAGIFLIGAATITLSIFIGWSAIGLGAIAFIIWLVLIEKRIMVEKR